MRHNMLIAAACASSLAMMAPPKDKGDAKAPAPEANSNILADGIEGDALLAAVANSENGELLMTSEQASAGIAAGHLIADESRIDGDRAPVKLTDAGFAAFQASSEGDNAQAEQRAASKPATAITVDKGIAPPSGVSMKRGGRSGGYPFADLELPEGAQYGDSFHVPVSEKMPDPAKSLASTVSGARASFAEETGETKTVKVAVYQKDEKGEFVKGADGKRIKTGETEETRPVMRLTRDFIVRPVGEDDPKGKGARVWRVALSENPPTPAE